MVNVKQLDLRDSFLTEMAGYHAVRSQIYQFYQFDVSPVELESGKF